MRHYTLGYINMAKEFKHTEIIVTWHGIDKSGRFYAGYSNLQNVTYSPRVQPKVIM